MGKLEDWAPVFRFVEKFNKSEIVGLVYLIVFVMSVIVAWYWICFKGGAGIWGDKLISLNKRFGRSTWYITPFILKVFASVFLLASLISLFIILLTKGYRRY